MVKDYNPPRISPILDLNGLICEQKRIYHRFLFHIKHEIKTPPTEEEHRTYIQPVIDALSFLDETIKTSSPS
jgi:hypothetical protein